MKDRLTILQKNFPEGAGAVLITSPVNRQYYLDFRSSAGVILATKKKGYFIVDSRYFEAAQSAIKSCEVVLQEQKLLEQVKKLLKQHRVKQLAIESMSVTVSELAAYKEAFAGVEIITGDGLSKAINRQRAIKSPEEIGRIATAQKIADAAFTHILNYIEAGRTELEIAVEMEHFCRREGSEEPAFSFIVAAGGNSSIPHAVPSENTIRTGDFVTMDYGCTVGGYRSDMTRTVAVGSVSPRQQLAYETVLDAQLAAIDAVRDGVECKAVDKVARDLIDATEFKGAFTHGLGHCLGLDIHESPALNTVCADRLEAGMVTSVEPGVYLPGQFGLRIEDIVVVTGKGCENLCTSPKELIIL